MIQKVITLIEIFDNQYLAEIEIRITDSLSWYIGSTDYGYGLRIF